ncbi:hypothetical protein [Leifsonia sp. C5G2]|uniref:tetratricopeptide repeat protein n=1 Tax=Leifsonia sp. C5G2 TaxID=2735269 RepID=UPI0015854A92|nr:hypothetical protein [Leifsonia sp. C5G2]NUU05846.1 hypothetical protein [Leifsonia sp. C5G2]
MTDDSDPSARALERGRMLRELGRLDHAADILGRALAQEPDHVGLLVELSDVAYAQGDFRRAADLADAALAGDPADGSALISAADAARRLDDDERALELSATVVERHPLWAPALRCRYLALADAFQDAPADEPRRAAWGKEAKRIVDRLAEEGPKDLTAAVVRSLYTITFLGDMERATDEVRDALALFPDNAELLSLLARLEAQNQETAAATAYARAALSTAPDDETARKVLLRATGDAMQHGWFLCAFAGLFGGTLALTGWPLLYKPLVAVELLLLALMFWRTGAALRATDLAGYRRARPVRWVLWCAAVVGMCALLAALLALPAGGDAGRLAVAVGGMSAAAGWGTFAYTWALRSYRPETTRHYVVEGPPTPVPLMRYTGMRYALVGYLTAPLLLSGWPWMYRAALTLLLLYALIRGTPVLRRMGRQGLTEFRASQRRRWRRWCRRMAVLSALYAALLTFAPSASASANALYCTVALVVTVVILLLAGTDASAEAETEAEGTAPVGRPPGPADADPVPADRAGIAAPVDGLPRRRQWGWAAILVVAMAIPLLANLGRLGGSDAAPSIPPIPSQIRPTLALPVPYSTALATDGEATQQAVVHVTADGGGTFWITGGLGGKGFRDEVSFTGSLERTYTVDPAADTSLFVGVTTDSTTESVGCRLLVDGVVVSERTNRAAAFCSSSAR